MLRLYRVIYNAIEDVEAAMKGMLDPVFEEKVHWSCRSASDIQGIRCRNDRRCVCAGRYFRRETALYVSCVMALQYLRRTTCIPEAFQRRCEGSKSRLRMRICI